jgi:redox-sensitive bicupin YhaK (pirin superfamily)
MEPEGFSWRQLPGIGVSQKVLGRFTEDDVYVSNYRWDEAGGVLDLSPERTQLVWIIDGNLTVDGESYDPETVIISEYGESSALSGAQDTQVVVFGLALPAPA